ncbi:MAG: glycerophosphoryl diester phosphodiesterase membrane domain-containing protein [Ruminococcus sp.]|nr:glycerophosphoryl diester phosphodiesterase membrane domain-containing protein [Ruminococcus sp.]
MKKKFFGSAAVFLRAMPHFLVFEMLFKLILMGIGAPAMTKLLKVTMKAAGITYLSDESLLVYLKKPVTLAVIVIIMFMMALFSFIELSALAGCFACFQKKQRLSASGMLKTGILAFVKAFRGTGILHFLMFMLFMPLAQFTLSSGMFMAPALPIVRRLFRPIDSRLGVAALILMNILFILFMVSRSYSLHLLVLTNKRFSDCTKTSREMIGKNKLRMTLSLILWSLFMIAAAAAVTFIISFIVLLFIKGISRPGRAVLAALKVLRYAGKIFMAVSAFFSAPAIMCWLTWRFLMDYPEDGEIVLPTSDTNQMGTAPRAALAVMVAVVAFMLNFSYFKSLYQGNISLNVGILSKTQITAHRGASREAPENTLEAFEAALDSGADYIELDVQLTKDGQLVVFHDETIDRTTTGKGKLCDITYDELQKYSAGSWFGTGNEFAGARVPLLSEVLDLVGDDIMLNIEIKDHGDIVQTVEKTVELIHEYDITDSCYVTSFSYKALKNVKKLDPKIKTGLIANVAAASGYSRLKYVDVLSLNQIFVNATVVSAAHQNGKRVFVWTVDQSNDMKKMISLGVDNIITNRPAACAKIVYSVDVGDQVLNILKTLFS